MPLPPWTSRHQPTVSRIFAVANAFAIAECSSPPIPWSCIAEACVHSAIDAVMFIRDRTSRSCTIWCAAIGLPNCTRSRA